MATIGERYYTYPRGHNRIDPDEESESLYLCVTCLNNGHATERGFPYWQMGDNYPVTLPGYLAWVTDDGNINEVHPPWITRIFTRMQLLANTHMDPNRGHVSPLGEVLTYDGVEYRKILVPIFCNFCNDKVGFQVYYSSDNDRYANGLPLLDMNTVYEY